MRLFSSQGPNPRVVELFLREKGVTIERVEVDLFSGEHLQPPHLARNALGQTPVLELDDGQCISQTTAICELIEELHPAPALIGTTPEERAETRMWVRRIDLNIVEPMVAGFRYGEGLAFFAERTRCIPEASDALKQIAQDNLGWLDGQMAGRRHICGDRFTLADIQLFSFVRFGNEFGQPLPERHRHIHRWFAAAAERLGDRIPA